MSANELLLWLSARREGSWQQFRQAVEELDLSDGEANSENDGEFPLYQQLRLDLERLAHVEFFAAGCEDGWRVAPPTLAAQLISGGVRGVLCGARSPALRERLVRAAQDLKCETLDSFGVPEVIRVVAANDSDLAELTAQTSLHFQQDAPLALLSHLPPCDPPLRTSSQAEFPQGNDWTIHAFSATNLKWRKSDRTEAQSVRFGVFRFLIHFQRPRYFLRWKRMTFEMPRAIALYALLRRHRRKVLSYDGGADALTVPAICRPPRLLERALVLCSGLPPVYADARLTYSDVPLEIARFAAELLRQAL